MGYDSHYSILLIQFNEIGMESIILQSLISLKSSNYNRFLSALRFTLLSIVLNFPISLIESERIEVLRRPTLSTFIFRYRFPSFSMVSRCSICLSLASETPKLSEKLASETPKLSEKLASETPKLSEKLASETL